jgi:hypothetical protein
MFGDLPAPSGGRDPLLIEAAAIVAGARTRPSTLDQTRDRTRA